MVTFQQIDEFWQELREGVLWSANEIRRTISRWDKNAQIDYFQQKTQVLSEEIVRIHKGYANMIRKDTNILTKKVFLLMSGLKKREILLKGLTFSLRLLEHPEEIKKGDISPAMIAQARSFPLGEIVEVNSGGFAHCVSHFPDKHPSMYCKGNWAHCFSCLYSSDVIGVYMKVNGASFVEAVKRLAKIPVETQKKVAKGKDTFQAKKTRQKQNAGIEKVFWRIIGGLK